MKELCAHPKGVRCETLVKKLPHIPKRRVYDCLGILEGAGFVEQKKERQRNIATPVIPKETRRELEEEERLDQQINDIQKQLRLLKHDCRLTLSLHELGKYFFSHPKFQNCAKFWFIEGDWLTKAGEKNVALRSSHPVSNWREFVCGAVKGFELSWKTKDRLPELPGNPDTFMDSVLI